MTMFNAYEKRLNHLARGCPCTIVKMRPYKVEGTDKDGFRRIFSLDKWRIEPVEDKKPEPEFGSGFRGGG